MKYVLQKDNQYRCSADYMAKVNISPKITYFPKSNIFATKLILTKTLVTSVPKFAQHDCMIVLQMSLICLKLTPIAENDIFLPKENNPTKN